MGCPSETRIEDPGANAAAEKAALAKALLADLNQKVQDHGRALVEAVSKVAAADAAAVIAFKAIPAGVGHDHPLELAYEVAMSAKEKASQVAYAAQKDHAAAEEARDSAYLLKAPHSQQAKLLMQKKKKAASLAVAKAGKAVEIAEAANCKLAKTDRPTLAKIADAKKRVTDAKAAFQDALNEAIAVDTEIAELLAGPHE